MAHIHQQSEGNSNNATPAPEMTPFLITAHESLLAAHRVNDETLPSRDIPSPDGVLPARLGLLVICL